MIYTVTLNPALDYIVTVDDFKTGKTNRTSTELMLAGGKGINVSIVLSNLGIKSVALGFVAGFVGDEIVKRLDSYGIESDFVRLREGNSRINVKLVSIDGTEINGQGPVIPRNEFDLFLDKISHLGENDMLILSGSVPKSMPENTYQIIMDLVKDKGVTVVVDAAKELLTNVLSYHPFLIKPNRDELSDIFDAKVTSWDEAADFAKKLQKMGARNVYVSMGKDGGVLVDENANIYRSPSPAERVVNTVGAGDSLVAGFIAGCLEAISHADGSEKDALRENLEKINYEHAFKMGMAAGAASTSSEYLAKRDSILKMYEKL